MNTSNVTLVQAAAVLISTNIGVGVLHFPLIATREVDTGAPLLTFLAGVIAFFGLWSLTKLGNDFPGETIIEYSEKIVGRFFGKLYGWLSMVFFIGLTALAAREFGTVVVTLVLRETPLEVTVLVMLLLAAIFCRNTLSVFTYVHSFYLPFILIPGLFIVFFSLKDSKSIHLQPMLGMEHHDVGTALLTIIALFQGSFILTYLLPKMEKRAEAKKAVFWAMAVTTGFFVMIMTAVLALFGAEEIKQTMWPTLELARATAIPGNILQRLDVVFLALWVTAVFTTIFSSYMVSVQMFKQLCHVQDHKSFVFFILPITFLISMLPKETQQMYQVIKIVGQSGLLLTMVIPFLFLILAKIRHSGQKARGQDT